MVIQSIISIISRFNNNPTFRHYSSIIHKHSIDSFIIWRRVLVFTSFLSLPLHIICFHEHHKGLWSWKLHFKQGIYFQMEIWFLVHGYTGLLISLSYCHLLTESFFKVLSDFVVFTIMLLLTSVQSISCALKGPYYKLKRSDQSPQEMQMAREQGKLIKYEKHKMKLEERCWRLKNGNTQEADLCTIFLGRGTGSKG